MGRPEVNRNVVLIGMPGVGKSTVGVLLAKAMGLEFIDTDVLIQARQGRALQEIIDAEGTEVFCRIEEGHILSLDLRSHVIATGGSVVYSPAAMRHLKRTGVTVFLDLNLPALEKRIRNLRTRGIVMEPGQSLAEIFEKRLPLYRRYGDLTVDCAGRTQDQTVAEIVSLLDKAR